MFENPYGGESAWRSVERYGWLPGRHFLLNRWDADLGGKAFQGLQVIGRDPGTDALVSTFYDNAGNAETYRITASGDTWTFEGREQRATYVIAADASSMEVRWEWKDGAAWRPLCETRARRFEPAPAPRPN